MNRFLECDRTPKNIFWKLVGSVVKPSQFGHATTKTVTVKVTNSVVLTARWTGWPKSAFSRRVIVMGKTRCPVS